MSTRSAGSAGWPARGELGTGRAYLLRRHGAYVERLRQVSRSGLDLRPCRPGVRRRIVEIHRTTTCRTHDEVSNAPMTAQLLDRHSASPDLPAPRNLVAAALVGAVGVISFSVAVGSFVVGSAHRVQPSSAAEAGNLVAAVPTFVVGGLVHLAVAAALVAGRHRLRTVAVALTVVAALVVIGSAVMLLTGIDPSGGVRAGHPTTDGVAVLLLAAATYAGAALMAVPDMTEG
jgi:hypothetical protein